jgi:hypothetical protein
VEKDKDILYAYIWAIVGLLCLMPAIFVEGKSREMFLVAAGLFFIATIIQGRRLNFDLKTEDMVYGPW